MALSLACQRCFRPRLAEDELITAGNAARLALAWQTPPVHPLLDLHIFRSDRVHHRRTPKLLSPAGFRSPSATKTAGVRPVQRRGVSLLTFEENASIVGHV